ncbi:hypothetical protein DY000_02030948 [Brassica cretica]|uniref:Uncharacterized protein n=2 Tax=Brassica cretica TaxID=69181 RepID=A0ABQ7DUD4_BRACR|nr:hypothetical protein DY000_02030948 [Brassica cretica]
MEGSPYQKFSFSRGKGAVPGTGPGPQTAIDYHYGDTISRHSDYSLGSVEDESLRESFAIDTELPETRSDDYDEDYNREKNIKYHGTAMDDRGLFHTSSADSPSTSINRKHTPSIDVETQKQRGVEATPFALTYRSGIRLSHQPPTINSSNNPSIRFSRTNTRNGWEHPQCLTGRFCRTFCMHGSNLFCQPKKESAKSIDMRPLSSINGLVRPAKDSYDKAKMDELAEEIDRAIRPSDAYHSKKLDDFYYPFDNSISWLTTCTEEMKQDLAMLQKQHGVGAGRSTLIDAHTKILIDASIKALIDARLAPFEDRLQSFIYRLDGVFYPLRDSVYFLNTHLDALQHEMVMIQRQLDSQAEPSPSIDRRTRPSIDDDHITRRSKLVTEKSLHDKLDEITFSQDLLKEDVYQKQKDISETTYARLGMQQRNIGNLQHRMHANSTIDAKGDHPTSLLRMFGRTKADLQFN